MFEPRWKRYGNYNSNDDFYQIPLKDCLYNHLINQWDGEQIAFQDQG
jgi:hypothetical protein